MAREEKTWHPNFLEYMEMIINHPNYKGLPIDKKEDGSYRWIAPAESATGAARKKWCEDKAKELGFEIKPGVYADVMLAIHPTKWKVCQTCGRKMSLYYHYPNANFVKALNKKFGMEFTECDHISDIWDRICHEGHLPACSVASFLIEKGNLDLNPANATKDEVIDALELACRKGGKKCLGPGAMSNFPDRYDGFHTYNRCCRALQDKGRSKENLKSYTKDRRAYEYWSDGNIHAANQFMGSSFFKGTSADHIGPISLGFVHDPRYLQPMATNDNSTKRDRLLYEDVVKIIETFNRTKIYPMSWFSKEIWEFIKNNYELHQSEISTSYRDALKQNMANFMYILYYILENCKDAGKNFLTSSLLEPNYKYFKYTYTFDEKGNIISQDNRHFTKRNAAELERYKRIAIESVYDYNDKDNRHSTPYLTDEETNKLDKICSYILGQPYNSSITNENILSSLKSLISQIQNRLIKNL